MKTIIFSAKNYIFKTKYNIFIKNIFSQKAASAHAAEAQEADEGVSAGGGAQAQALPGRHQRRREGRGRGQRGTELPGRDPGRQRGVTRGTWRGDTRVAAARPQHTPSLCAKLNPSRMRGI